MEKLELSTPDITQENIDRIAELFPDVVTESLNDDGNLIRTIDFNALRQNLSGAIVDGPRERYQFTWPGKQAAKLEARKPCDKTMRPVRGESVNWDETENLYIEGDNLEALKIMRETYAGKVKLIYIDPPYNTGHDFIYDDDFAQTRAEYEAENGEFDDAGGRLVANPESNGRFHSDWCSMMYPRLLLARDLLSSDGVIFISIDDHEQKNLTSLCDEIFGASCFVTDVIWRSADASNNDAKTFSADYNHTLVYSKRPGWLAQRLPRREEDNAHYKNPDNDPRGPWFSGNVSSPNPRENLRYVVYSPQGIAIQPPKNGWRWSKERMDAMIAEKEVVFSSDGTRIIKKTFLRDQSGIVPSNLWIDLDETGHNRNAKYELVHLFPELPTSALFKTPKPTKLLRKIFKLINWQLDGTDIVLDFFAGSGTTADALMQEVAESGKPKKFILVQLPEEEPVDSPAYEAGFKTISDMCIERIRRAGVSIAAEAEEKNKQLKLGEDPAPIPDIGFRVLSIDSSNFRDTYLEPGAISQSTIFDYVDNLVEGRSAEDLLFQVMPKFRIPYSAKYVIGEISGKTVFNVNDGQLIACFDEDVDETVIEEIAKMRPLYAVFRDASMADDATAANFEELFKTYSPDTIRRVI